MCGIYANINSKEPVEDTEDALRRLQHRGFEAAGINLHDENGELKGCVRGPGMVKEVLTPEATRRLRTLPNIVSSVGHVRYTTVGTSIDAQPLHDKRPYGISMAHNGHVTNYLPQVQESRQKRHGKISDCDVEKIIDPFSESLRKQSRKQVLRRRLSETEFKELDEETLDRIVEEEEYYAPITKEAIYAAVREVHKKVKGAYSVVAAIGGEAIVAFKDLHGVRPLCWGTKIYTDGARAHAFSSEDVAFFPPMGYELQRELYPSEVVIIWKNGKVDREILAYSSDEEALENERFCFFEIDYFMFYGSSWRGKTIGRVRREFGRNGAHAYMRKISEKGRVLDKDRTIVLPVLDSGRNDAEGFADELGLDRFDGIAKNRYELSRAFMGLTPDERDSKSRRKHIVIPQEVKGKVVVVRDDSIVRANTARIIIRYLRDAGAIEVHWGTSCPRIEYSCHGGIDTPTSTELIAHDRTDDDIADYIGADLMVYPELASFMNIFGLPANRFSFCCLDGNYSMDLGDIVSFAKKRVNDRGGS